MAFTRVVGAGIHTAANINSHNIKSTGIITATKFDGPFDNINVSGAATFTGNVTIGGTLTYDDVTNIDSIGIITARNGLKVLAGGANIVGVVTATTFKGNGDFVDIDVDGHTELDNVNIAGVVTATLFNGASQVGIQSGGVQIGAGITQLNFIGTGNTFAVNGTTVDVSIQGGGAGAGGTWSSYTAGIATTKSVGVNTNNLDVTDLVGVGNSFQGLYISNGMMIMDNTLNGNHYIGTTMNGLMAGPVNIDGTLTVDGNYVVV
tara:strand:+ start:720 stop:1505 length:786 start_codon:yes stop_codon:yes gene_type:complete